MVEFLFNFLVYFIIVIGVLLALSFLTLLERKVLGFIQFRKGPNKVGVWGILQPFRDAIKLFSKERVFFRSINKYMYVLSSMLLLVFMLMGWIIIILFLRRFIFDLSLMYLFVFFGLGVYLTMFIGWASNSLYSVLGTLRGIVQRVSYEISLILMVTLLIFLDKDFRFFRIRYAQGIFRWLVNWNRILACIFFVSLLGELNRTPFDFLEGESELVSGFNVEYSRSLFALIFMAEYGLILFMRILWTYLFCGVDFWGVRVLLIILTSFSIIWVRAIFPRIRYDFMIMIFWKIFLPIVLFYYILIIGLLDVF